MLASATSSLCHFCHFATLSLLPLAWLVLLMCGLPSRFCRVLTSATCLVGFARARSPFSFLPRSHFCHLLGRLTDARSALGWSCLGGNGVEPHSHLEFLVGPRWLACPRWRSSGHSSGRPRTPSERWRGARRRRRPGAWRRSPSVTPRGKRDRCNS